MIPNEQALLENLGKIAYTLDKAYLSQLSTSYGVVPFDEVYNKDEHITYGSNIRAIQIKKLVYNKDEKILDGLKNILSLFSAGNDNIAMVIRRQPEGADIYFVLRGEGQAQNEAIKNDIGLLKSSVLGNFPGAEVEEIVEQNSGDDTKGIFDIDNKTSIASLCTIPSEKSKEFTSQHIEKLLNGVVPQTKDDSYTIIVLAEPISQNVIRNILNGYEEMATALAPFAGYQFQAGESETETRGEMESLSHAESTSRSISKTHSVNVGINGSIGSGTGTTHTEGSSSSLGGGVNVGGILGLVGFGLNFIPGVGPVLSTAVKAAGQVANMAGAAINASKGTFSSDSVSQYANKGIGASAGYGYSWGTTDTTGETDTKTTGTNHSISVGKNENTTYTYKSYVVSDLIKKIEYTINRINESQSNGLWRCGSYILSDNANTGSNVANFLRSIIQGDKSYIEPSIIQTWEYENSNGVTMFNEIRKYLAHFTHPVFGNLQDGTLINAASDISTNELSMAMSFPKTSVQGVPVISCAAFGRNVLSLDGTVPTENQSINIGNIYHMHKEECQDAVNLNLQSLASHTFVTGSTGSGKSHTIYKILTEAKKKGIKFLVIESAKGEYKNVFGNAGARVYGTNAKQTEQLRINPFSFPDQHIHIYEHLERLVEIFNACWPMYAAMPAVLKESIERAYISVGWDMEASVNDSGLFPTFEDVLKQIEIVMNETRFSADSKGDYIGALSTRLRSMTTGINRVIFSQNETSDKELFDDYAIVDLSRLGSVETKALIMGLLVMKQQEYRMSQDLNPNAQLNHITVLEEAHHLLKRTSTEQISEASNLMGKSVEMLANSIAEMRTYGEGFIIADQSPGLMDMSVIRNTNTKIILRLPDYADRELVGKAAGLNDNQIEELAKLKRGVAAIYQNDWIEPVLCAVSGENFHVEKYVKPYTSPISSNSGNNITNDIIELLINHKKIDNVDSFKDRIKASELRGSIKALTLKYIDADEKQKLGLASQLAGSIFNTAELLDIARSCETIEKWEELALLNIKPKIYGYNQEERQLLLWLVLSSESHKSTENDRIFRAYGDLQNRRNIK